MKWHQIAGATGFKPGVRMILEELREFAEEIGIEEMRELGEELFRVSQEIVNDLQSGKKVERSIANKYKEFSDFIVTVGGLAQRCGLDYNELARVYQNTTDSNFSKFVDATEIFSEQEVTQFCNEYNNNHPGETYTPKRVGDFWVIYDQNGKIRKGPRYFPAKI